MNLTPQQRTTLQLTGALCFVLILIMPWISFGVAAWLWACGAGCLILTGFSFRGPWGW